MTASARSGLGFAAATLLAGQGVIASVQKPHAPPSHVKPPDQGLAAAKGLAGAPPEPARLTVRQFQNAVTDLFSEDSRVVPDVPAGGLRGRYFAGRDENDKNLSFTRQDAGVQFDFGTKSPDAGSIPTKAPIDPHVFKVVWDGSVLAPDTGDYDFVVQTNQSAQLMLNGWDAPVVDASIKSANQTEWRATLHLLGGRAYPIRLDFEKSTQGVDDGKAKARPSPPASITLLWRPPHRPEVPIPGWCLYPAYVSPSFVLSTPFPPDDRSMGFDRGNAVSKDWDDAVTAAALEAAGFVADHLGRLADVKDDAKDRKDRVLAYCRKVVERAFRRPLSPDLQALYVDRQFAEAPNLETGAKRVVLLALQSPRFLYRDMSTPRDAANVASDLSFDLWDSLPDEPLRQAVEKGELATPEQISRQADRLANDPRAWFKLRDFLMAWLKVDDIPEIVKDRKTCGGFDSIAASDLRDSFELFLKNTVGSDASDYRELMTSPTLYMNARLARLYDVRAPDASGFVPVQMPGGERCGVMTQPYLLARLGYVDSSDPIHRGVLLVRNLLGRVLNPPPAAFIPTPASAHPDLTTRERVALQTSPKFCQQCHGIINPLGFTLERYDAIGRLRDRDAGKPIDTAGQYVAGNGQAVKLAGPADLGRYLADGDDPHRAFVQRLFQFMTKQPIAMIGPSERGQLLNSFVQNRYSIRRLMAAVAVTAARVNETPAPTVGQSPHTPGKKT